MYITCISDLVLCLGVFGALWIIICSNIYEAGKHNTMFSVQFSGIACSLYTITNHTTQIDWQNKKISTVVDVVPKPSCKYSTLKYLLCYIHYDDADAVPICI